MYDVRAVLPDTGVKSDAVAIALDHRDNYSVVVMIPYTLQNRNVRFGSTFAQKGDDQKKPPPKNPPPVVTPGDKKPPKGDDKPRKPGMAFIIASKESWIDLG